MYCILPAKFFSAAREQVANFNSLNDTNALQQSYNGIKLYYIYTSIRYEYNVAYIIYKHIYKNIYLHLDRECKLMLLVICTI